MSRKALFVAAIGVASIASSFAVAQDQPEGGERRQRQGQEGGGPGGPGGPGGGRNFDPAQFRQQMMDRMKEEMKAPDDEWGVIQPKLEAVTNAQNDLRGGFGGRGGRGGGPGGNESQGELARAQRELRTAVESENVSPSTIADRLKAYRDARGKAEEKLKAAREELKGVLTERQEAYLVSRGILE